MKGIYERMTEGQNYVEHSNHALKEASQAGYWHQGY